MPDFPGVNAGATFQCQGALLQPHTPHFEHDPPAVRVWLAVETIGIGIEYLDARSKKFATREVTGMTADDARQLAARLLMLANEKDGLG